MRRAALIVAVLACCGCQSSGTQTPAAETAVPGPSAAIVNRVWARSDSTGLPGTMRVFLADGTLLMDSCWETYQLVKWRAESDSVIAWQEGTAEIRARVMSLKADELVLRLELADGSQEERYRPATVPYLCPDMPR